MIPMNRLGDVWMTRESTRQAFRNTLRDIEVRRHRTRTGIPWWTMMKVGG